LPGIPFHFPPARTSYIHIPLPAIIIDNGSVVDEGSIAIHSITIVIQLWGSDILPVNKTPVIAGGRIISERQVYAYAELWPQWRPAIIIAATAPANPGWRPIIARDPKPAIGIIKEPTAVVERRPAPAIV
jgi:hypothetical protein